MWVFSYLRESLSGLRGGQPRDLIIEITGSFGKYQLWLCFIVFLSKFFIAFNHLSIIFYSPPTKFKCADTEPPTQNTCPCSNPIYDRSIFTHTVVMEWNLICERKLKASYIQMVFQCGTLLGSILFGAASDWYGRKGPFNFACTIQCIFGIAGAYCPNYELFVVTRFIVGLSVGGTMVIGFVILMEFIGPDYREVISALYQVPFNLGTVILPGIAYHYRSFREYQLAISLPTLVFIIYFYSLPETPRWLIAKQKTERAIKILTHTAKMNNRPTENIKSNVEAFAAMQARTKVAKGTVADLFRTPNLRKNIIGMAINWLMCSYCYFGLAQYVGTLGGDIFTNVAASSALVTFGTFLSIPIMKLAGRRTILLICQFICGTCLIFLAFNSEGLISVVSATIGSMTAFIAFVVVYLYCGEMFPTVVRNAAVGFSSMCARVGSIVAPAVIDLKDISPMLPPLGFAVLPIVSFCVTIFMPETKGMELLTTIEQGEAFGKKKEPGKK